VHAVLDEVGGPNRILAAGLANQGETVVAWDAADGRPLAPAVSWQCRRSIPVVERIRDRGLEPEIRRRTGLPLDPYFSASKMTWLLEQVPPVRAAADAGSLRFGTVDAWLTARLAGTALTDPSTASRTQLLRLDRLDWDDELLGWFGIPRPTLPTIVASAGHLVEIAHPAWGGSLLLSAMACDQQAALAGHRGFAPGAVKATYGTGVFVLANAGHRLAPAPGLETSIAWTLPDGSSATVLQGGLHAAGALLNWLRDDLGLVGDPAESEALASSVPDSAGVRVLPALAGLGAPWWRPRARTVISGLSAASARAHLVRAALDGIAHGVADIVDAMRPELPAPVVELRVDGGLTTNAYLMGRQADLLGVDVAVAEAEESTALGIATLAAIGRGVMHVGDLPDLGPVRRRFHPRLAEDARRTERAGWTRFVERTADLDS
jgi:glycerol kinase